MGRGVLCSVKSEPGPCATLYTRKLAENQKRSRNPKTKPCEMRAFFFDRIESDVGYTVRIPRLGLGKRGPEHFFVT